jgi:hypothetical protein
VKACGATASTKEYFIATRRFTKKPEREKLLTMEKTHRTLPVSNNEV